MGCVNACICGGLCVACHDYIPESYCGEAEDLYDRTIGKTSMDREYEEYCKAMEEEYYKEYGKALMEQQDAEI